VVECQLPKLGIDSARLTTDARIDLVADKPASGAATTMQVKTVERSLPGEQPGGGAVWEVPPDRQLASPASAELFAPFDLPYEEDHQEQDRTHGEFKPADELQSDIVVVRDRECSRLWIWIVREHQ